MGNISSRLEDTNVGAIYIKDQNRLNLKSLTISNGRKRVLLRLSPNIVPAARLIPKRDLNDDTPVSYIQDPESSNANFLLRLDLEDQLDFQFTFLSRQTTNLIPGPTVNPASPPTSVTVDTNVTGLTFAFAANARELDNLVTREFHSDPNLHKNSNVQLIGDLNTNGLSSIEYDWSWTWRPPKADQDKGGGWRNNCSLLEYDSRAHRLNTLASFSFWVHKASLPTPVIITNQPSELLAPHHRHRLPSSQSYQSAVSDSEGLDPHIPISPPGVQSEFAFPSGQPPPIPPAGDPLPIVDVNRPPEDMSNVDDGPVFRANMKNLESKTSNMRSQIKKVLKRAEAAQLAQTESNDAMKAFLNALQEAASSNASAFKPALEHYFNNIAKRILRYEEENGILLRKQIIEPLSRLYTNDIKQVDLKKKDFEDESREYYAYVSRYLGQRNDSMKEKKRAESDSKYQNKKKNFELKRFDYSNFMQDLHGGRKEQELLSQFTRYADHQSKSFVQTAKRIEELQPRLDALVKEVSEVDKEYKLQRSEREERRRNLETNIVGTASSEAEPLTHTYSVASQTYSVQQNVATGYNSDTELSRADSTSSQFRGHFQLSPSNSQRQNQNGLILSGSPNGAVSTPNSKFKGIRDLEEPTQQQEKAQLTQGRKEGLLWALSKPGSHIDPKGINKQAWHKFWVVLDQGKLSEYSNWKEKMELHRDPIDLRMASVRIARDAERRFCFEVITPQYKRVYQATAEDDMTSWINSINSALQSAFEGGANHNTPPQQKTSRTGSDFGAVLMGKTSSVSGPHSNPARPPNVGDGGVIRRVTVGSRPLHHQTHTAPAVEENPSRLLDRIRANDAGNQFCADCGSNSKVEWCSLNLGIIVCIECGGIHRSLGTHISKVRSLTLDTQAFTDDIVEILLQVGNRISNMIWEARMDRSQKPEPWATREQRLRFITAKYVEHSFVDFASTTAYLGSPNDNLIMFIKKNEIQGVLQSIAHRADVNSHDRSRNTHAVFLALAAADPARPNSTSGSPQASPDRVSSAGSSSVKTFPVAELLLQNGAEVPVELPAIPLSEAARSYLEQRAQARQGGIPDTLGPLPIVGNRPADQAAKLQKRSSAGSRFAGRVSNIGISSNPSPLQDVSGMGIQQQPR